MSGDHKPSAPAAYSYDTTSDGALTGHTVTIAPGQLDATIDTFQKSSAGQRPTDLIATLSNAMLIDDDFGKIPSAAAANAELQKFITAHAEVMASMGSVLADFVARVQAAAQLGYETDPQTRRELARVNAHER